MVPDAERVTRVALLAKDGLYAEMWMRLAPDQEEAVAALMMSCAGTLWGEEIMHFRLALAAAAVIMPALAVAEPGIGLPLPLGKAITDELRGADDATEVTVVGIGVAALDDNDEQAAQKMAGVPCTTLTCEAMDLKAGEDGITARPTPKPRQIHIRFLTWLATKHTMLILENGYDRGLTYRVQITRDGKTTPTDVCLVLPNKRGYEDWPYTIEKIEISAFGLQPRQDGDPVPCA